jgi:N-acetylglucosaminyldiphosphoundecaprenol N-acetyl-beta-D-mannosaminyltransferase
LRALDTINLLNTDIHAVTEQEVVDLVEQAICDNEALRIGVVNAAKLVNMQTDPLLADDVKSSDLVLADGMSAVWASRILGEGLPDRVTGCDLMYRFFELANRRQWRVYCLGATEEISALVEKNLSEQYPNLIMAGRRNGYFSTEEESEIAQAIAASKAHFLLVAMTSPKKENFMGTWGNRMNVPIVHGVGGSFDVYSGLAERAPTSWQNLGLEWLYRVKQEPRRLWKRYLITNTKFVWFILREGIQKILGKGSTIIRAKS